MHARPAGLSAKPSLSVGCQGEINTTQHNIDGVVQTGELSNPTPALPLVPPAARPRQDLLPARQVNQVNPVLQEKMPSGASKSADSNSHRIRKKKKMSNRTITF